MTCLPEIVFNIPDYTLQSLPSAWHGQICWFVLPSYLAALDNFAGVSSTWENRKSRAVRDRSLGSESPVQVLPSTYAATMLRRPVTDSVSVVMR